MSVSVSIETPLQADVRQLVDQLNDHLLPLSPLEYQFKMTAEEMAGEDTTVFVARRGDNSAVGIGALKKHKDGIGEVKRMFTLPDVRGLRVGSAILTAVETEARKRNLNRLVLETGVGEGFQAEIGRAHV